MDKERLNECLENKGLNISQIEKELGFGNGALRKDSEIKSDRLLALAKRLDVSMEYLMGEEKSAHSYIDYIIKRDEVTILIDSISNKLTEENKQRLIEYANMLRLLQEKDKSDKN